MAESRRVVGLLREPAYTPSEKDSVESTLRDLLERFGERTGVHSVFEEKGKASALSERQVETLQFALQEALTNAHRHGSARHVWVQLDWIERTVALHVRDDGQGETTPPLSDGTHHGLQGMRERAEAIGGAVEAGSMESGGFAVRIQLPLGTTLPVQLQGERA
jgi:signal transduction histidine kinase